MRSARTKLALALAAALCVGGCSEKYTVLNVNITARPGVHNDEPGEESEPTSLEVTFKSAQDQIPQQTILNLRGGETMFPASGARTSVFSIVANGQQGPVEVSVEARGGKPPLERVLGLGSATATLVADQDAETTLTLIPTGFQVNTEYAKGQIFSTERPGRQVAADKDGNFVVMWVPEFCDQHRCDIHGRLFDHRAKARQNADRGSKLEFRVNPNTTYYDQPAVAMQPDGSYMVAWANGSVGKTVIQVGSFLADGRPNPSNAAVEALSDDTKVAQIPDIAAMDEKTYVVCWAQASGSGYEVLCRRLDANGTPIAGAGGSSEAFSAIKVDPASAAPNSVSVSVAAGPQGGFMVVWSEECQSTLTCRNYRGRIFNSQSKAFGAIVAISKPVTGAATQDADVVGLAYGYMVTWADAVSTNAGDGIDIMAVRVGINGTPLEDPFRVNTSVASDQTQPTIARLPGGDILIAWTTADASQDPGGGLRGRAILGNGLPVGNDFPVNYRSVQLQHSAALAPVGRDAYVVVFQDDSEAGRDQSDAAIRGRLLYPDYDVNNGGVGSKCTMGNAQSCGGGLVCQLVSTPSTTGEPRCVNTCVANGPCANGGRCQKLAGQEKYLCLYQDR